MPRAETADGQPTRYVEVVRRRRCRRSPINPAIVSKRVEGSGTCAMLSLSSAIPPSVDPAKTYFRFPVGGVMETVPTLRLGTSGAIVRICGIATALKFSSNARNSR